MEDLHISLLQTDIFWEDPMKNIRHFGILIDDLYSATDLIVLPEMFNTGFSINPERCAETMDGSAIRFMREKAAGGNRMIMGSMMIKEGASLFNRLICMYPDGTFQQYDKRHLFRLSEEYKILKSGRAKTIINYKGWKILPLICYDLRFPIWSKNRWTDGEYEFDLLVYVANWPQSRSHIWKALLAARAIENQCYVIGVNRIGKDGYGTSHAGDSMVIGPEGEILASAEKIETSIVNATLSGQKLLDFRRRYPFAPDWDQFTIHP